MPEASGSSSPGAPDPPARNRYVASTRCRDELHLDQRLSVENVMSVATGRQRRHQPALAAESAVDPAYRAPENRPPGQGSRIVAPGIVYLDPDPCQLRCDSAMESPGESAGKAKTPPTHICYGSTGPEQRRGRMIEADASAGRRGLSSVWHHDRQQLKIANANPLSRPWHGKPYDFFVRPDSRTVHALQSGHR